MLTNVILQATRTAILASPRARGDMPVMDSFVTARERGSRPSITSTVVTMGRELCGANVSIIIARGIKAFIYSLQWRFCEWNDGNKDYHHHGQCFRILLHIQDIQGNLMRFLSFGRFLKSDAAKY